MDLPGINLLTLHKSLHLEIIKHALGINTKVMVDCIPEDQSLNVLLVQEYLCFYG